MYTPTIHHHKDEITIQTHSMIKHTPPPQGQEDYNDIPCQTYYKDKMVTCTMVGVRNGGRRI